MLFANLMQVMAPVFNTEDWTSGSQASAETMATTPATTTQLPSDEEYTDQELHADTAQIQLIEDEDNVASATDQQIDDSASAYTYSGMTLAANSASISTTKPNQQKPEANMKYWTFLDMVDRPKWPKHIDDATALVTDFIWPVVKSLLIREKLPLGSTNLDEITQIMLWTSCLHITTNMTIPDLIANALHMALKPWIQGKHARRIVLNGCIQVSENNPQVKIPQEKVEELLIETLTAGCRDLKFLIMQP